MDQLVKNLKSLKKQLLLQEIRRKTLHDSDKIFRARLQSVDRTLDSRRRGFTRRRRDPHRISDCRRRINIIWQWGKSLAKFDWGHFLIRLRILSDLITSHPDRFLMHPGLQLGGPCRRTRVGIPAIGHRGIGSIQTSRGV